MAFVNHFYNATTRKYVALFGTIFNKMRITRTRNTGEEAQSVIVPIAYGPFQKFLSRITQDPNLDNPSAITLPRMSFEITNMVYDGTRKIASKQRMQKTIGETDDQKSFVWSGAPYNIDFSLYIMTKYSEDATKIVEQIIPFFRPEWTATVKLIDDLPPLDIPIILNGITNEDLYEGSYEERRSVLWTLNFTMKAWYFGPERKKSVIKFVDADLWTDTDASKDPEEGVNVFPGLTANGTPTTDPDLTIPYTNIEFDDDWSVIRVITSNPEDE
jgi:hypothetical protein